MQTMEYKQKVRVVTGRRGPKASIHPNAAAVGENEKITAKANFSIPSDFCTPRTPLAAATLEESRSEDQQRMIVEHLPAVRYIARRIHERLPQHVELEELVSAGVLGLIDAFRKFDSTKQVQFGSYAQFRIRGAILDSLRTLDWSPRDLRRKGRAVEEAIRAVTARRGSAPTESEVAAELQIDLGAYQQLLSDLKGLEIGTLHVEHTHDSDQDELSYLPARAEDDPLFQCMRGEMQARVAEAVSALPERERLVMTLYYFEELNMREIGLTLGVVESRVSQIHSSAVLHLRSRLAGMAQGAGPRGTKSSIATIRHGSAGSPVK